MRLSTIAKSLLLENITLDDVYNTAAEYGIDSKTSDFTKFVTTLTNKKKVEDFTPYDLQKISFAIKNAAYPYGYNKEYYKPIELPYAYTALGKLVNKEIMQIHYEDHYINGYTKKLNILLSQHDGAVDRKIETLISNINKYDDKVRNEAGGYYNHTLFWKFMSPNPVEMDANTIRKIIAGFESIDNFKSKFEEVAKGLVGSGWVWVIINNKEIKIVKTQNQNNPLMRNKNAKILLGLDLYEHSYHLQYKTDRDSYIHNFWNVCSYDIMNKHL